MADHVVPEENCIFPSSPLGVMENTTSKDIHIQTNSVSCQKLARPPPRRSPRSRPDDDRHVYETRNY